MRDDMPTSNEMTLPQIERYLRTLNGENLAHGLILRVLMQHVPQALEAVKAIDLDRFEKECMAEGALHLHSIKAARKKLAAMQATPLLTEAKA